jgi:predicted permease
MPDPSMDSWRHHVHRRLASLDLGPAREAEIIEELSQHLDERHADLRAAGLSDEEARRLALDELLDLDALAAAMRPLRQARASAPAGFRVPGRLVPAGLAQDVRQAARSLRTQPGLAATAALTLALGIGATTAIFSVVKSVLIDPLPFPDADALVSIVHTIDGRDEPYFGDTIFLHYVEQSRTLEDVGVWNPYAGSATITGSNTPEEVRALTASRTLLTTLGVRPEIGRVFSPQDDTPGAANAVMLSYGFWQRRFGGDPAVLTQSLTINSAPHQVIGVMPSGFTFGGESDIVLPLRANAAQPVPVFRLLGVARLKPGVTLAQANADGDRILADWKTRFVPADSAFGNTRYASTLRPLKQEVIGDIGRTLWVLMGTIAIVLLMACANIANLLLVRAGARRQEFAIRSALGARWTRIARGLLVESFALALLGGAAGVGVAATGLRLLVAMAPTDMPRLPEIVIDTTVLGFALAVSAASALLFGVVPIAKYATPGLATLAGGNRTASGTPERQRSQQAMVTVQIAFALVLLVGSGLMIRSYRALRGVEPGFEQPHRVQTFSINVPPAQVADGWRVIRVQHEILDRIRAVPGVVSAAFTSRLPMETSGRTSRLYLPEGFVQKGGTPPSRQMRFVSPGLFQTLGNRLLAGRDFTWSDVYEGRTFVAILTDNLAREWWGSPSAAIGKRIRNGNEGPWLEVIGVSQDIYDAGADQAPTETVFLLPGLTRIAFVARSDAAGTAALLDRLRQAVWSVNPDMPLAQVRTLGDLYDQSMARTSFTLALLSIAGATALLLGISGIYGVIAYAVTQRRREIGVRLALGASARAIHRLFLRRGLAMTAVGLIVGAGGALILARLMRTLLFGIGPLDPLTFAVTAVLLATAAAIATYVPARRALAVDPVETMRTE